MTQYRVTAPCLVHVPFDTPQGRQLGTLYAGAVLPDSAPNDKVKFWLDGGMIEEVKTAEPEPAQEPESKGPEVSKSQGPDPVPARQPGVEVDPDPDVPVPSVLTGRTPPPESGPGSGKAAWVDYAVAKGKDRAEAEGMSRDDLIKALKPAE